MVEANPYVTPTSEVVNKNTEFGDPLVLSFKSRAGRLRYLARVSLLTMALYAVFGALAAGLIGQGPPAAEDSPIFGAYTVAFVVSTLFGLMFAIQRLHDLNRSGWMAVLLIVPLVNGVVGLYLMLAAGTEGANDYGPPPPPNTLGIKLVACVMPAIVILGILAAIAIPAYQDYATRAQAQIGTEFE